MKKTRKMLAMLLSMMLVAVVAIGGTYAYLTSTTETVVNTFTVGSVNITLDETDVDVYGVKDGDTRVTENTYKLIPGHTYVKDPIVHVTAGSEKCWLFVKVVDEIAAIQDTTKVADQMAAKGWSVIDATNGIYAYAEIVDASAAAKDVPVFDNFKVLGTAEVAQYEDETIEITAYAVQADGFTTAQAAWTATYGAPAEA